MNPFKLVLLFYVIPSLLSSSFIKHITLDDLQTSLHNFSVQKNTYKVYDGFDRFFIEPLRCQQKSCTFPIIEVTNFKNGQNYIKSLPTVLLTSGFDGRDMIGINLVLNFARLLGKKGPSFLDTEFLLNNFRFIIAPIVNMTGFLNKNEIEKGFDKDHEFNPLSDFPMRNDIPRSCLVSSTARIIHGIFTENLIIGAFNFQRGEYVIGFPWSVSKNHYKNNADVFVSGLVARELSSFAKHKGERLNMHFHVDQIYRLEDQLENKEGRNYEDWAFSASWNVAGFNKQCLADSFDVQDLKKSDDYPEKTNASFVLLFQTGKDDINKIEDDVFEEKMTVFSSLIQHAASFINPKVELESINYTRSTKTAKINLNIKGCIEVDKFNIISNHTPVEPEKLKFHNSLLIHVSFDIILDEDDNNGELITAFLCKDKWNRSGVDSEPHIHTLKLREQSDYRVEHNGYHYYNKRNNTFTIFNFHKKIIENDFIEPENYDSYTELIYEENLVAVFESFSLNITYTPSPQNSVRFKIANQTDNFPLKEEDLEFIIIREYGEKGCCNFLAAGETEENLLVRETRVDNRRGFYDLIGKLLIIKFKGDKKKYPAVIKLSNEEDKGYMIPPGGLVCSSHNISEKDYFYVVAKEHNNDIRMEIFTNHDDVAFVRFLKEKTITRELDVYNSDKYGKVYYYEAVMNKFVQQSFDIDDKYKHLGSLNFSSKIKGRFINFFTNENEFLFRCAMGLKNPFYDEFTNILYGFENYSPNAGGKISRKAFFGIMIAVYCLAFILAVVGFVCYTRIKKKKTERALEFRKIKVDSAL